MKLRFEVKESLKGKTQLVRADRITIRNGELGNC